MFQAILHETWRNHLQKPLQGYVRKYKSQLLEIDLSKLKQTCKKYITSKFEGTENRNKRFDLISHRNKRTRLDTANRRGMCKNQVEYMFHVIHSCSRISSRYHRHLL